MKAVVIKETGNKDKLNLSEVPDKEPAPNEVKIKIKYAGINFIDIYFRKGVYKKDLPFIPGQEAAGVVSEVGSDVKEFSVGDNVAYCMFGESYSEYNCVPEDKVVKIPKEISLKQAGSVMLQGLTVHYLTQSTYPIMPEDKALVHAASGGVGLLLVQVLKLLGAKVIGTTSTDEKKKIVEEMGADFVFDYDDFDKKTLASLGKIDVVYDSVGHSTFNRSLDVLKPRGYLVLFGQSSGLVESFNPALLAQKGSLFLTRPTLNHYILTKEELRFRSEKLFNWISNEQLKLTIDSIHNLEDAGNAHDRLEQRLNKGKVLLRV